MTAAAPPARALTVLVAALGGEGGGLLTDWIVGAASVADLPVQSTSIPGVAQRTGATTYYTEIFPLSHAALGGRAPVMSLYPSPGDVDVMIASELVEAGRAIENGFVTPERTTLIASTHRIYVIGEKSAMGDGIHDGARVIEAARQAARRAILFDLAALARERGAALNAVQLGILAGSEIVPVPVAAFEESIRARGVAVEANLAGFAVGRGLVRGEIAAPAPAVPRHQPRRAAPGLDDRLRAEFPAELHELLTAAVGRLADYQDVRYAAAYLDRLGPILAADRDGAARGWALSRETARQLALWMSYEDVIRVADLKSRAARRARVRAEAGAKAGEPVRVTEFLKPGVEEVAAVLPRVLGRALTGWAERGGRRLNVPLKIRSHTLTGHLMLRLLARLRPWRRRSYRFAEEQALLARWLDAVRRAAERDPDLALEVAACAGLNKGYGDTHARGRGNFLHILETLIEPALAGPPAAGAAARVARAREAALADPEGKALAQALAAAEPASGGVGE